MIKKSIRQRVLTYLRRGVEYAVSGLKAVFRIPLTSSVEAIPSLDATFTRSTAGTYIDSNGVIQTAAINEPRFQDGGLLVEPAATNLFINSSTPVTQNITVTSGTSYTVWGTGAGSIVLSGAGSGTVTATAPITFTASTSTLTCTVTNMSTVQVERGTAPTSYIPTSGAATTRTADVLTYNVSDVITQGQGSFYCEFTPRGRIGSTEYILYLSDGTTNNRLYLYINGSTKKFTLNGYTAGSVVVAIGSMVEAVNEVTYKVLISYKNNSIKLYINGVLINTDTSCTIPIYTHLNVMCTHSGTLQANGNIKNIKYFKEVISEAEAVRLTS